MFNMHLYYSLYIYLLYIYFYIKIINQNTYIFLINTHCYNKDNIYIHSSIWTLH